MKTITTLILAAIAYAIQITAGTVSAQQSAILSVGWKNKTLVTNAYETGLSKDSVDYAVYSDVCLENLLNAIAIVEGGSSSTNRMGDFGQAAGVWQLREIAVRHVNEKFGTTYSWPSDCLNEKTARQIAKRYLIICGYGKKSLEETVRRFNGGYKYWQGNMAGRYWQNVKKLLVLK